MNEIEDFIEDPNENSDLFDCEFTSVDAVVNQIMVFTGWQNRATENGDRTLVAYGGGLQSVCFLYGQQETERGVLQSQATLSVPCNH